MNELENYRKKLHTNIRKANIHEYLARNRFLVQPFDKSEKPEITAHFEHLKRMATSQSERQELLYHLLNLRKIVSNYSVASLISKKLDLTDSPRVRLIFGQNHKEMTNLDLLVFLLRNNHSILIMRELTYIIHYCIGSLTRNILKQFEVQNTKIYIECVKRAVQNYSFNILEYNDLQIVENVCSFLYNSAISCCDDGSTIYYLINKLKPGILIYFIDLIKQPLIMNVSDTKHELITTILTVLFYVNRYNLANYQSQILNQLVFRLKEIILNEILKKKSSQDFKIYCDLMVVLCENKQLHITKQEFILLQNLIPEYIYYNQDTYFNLLQKVVFTHTHTLAPQSYQNIMRYIFYKIEQYKHFQPKESKFKIMLLNIFHHHITNCGNQFRLQDAEVFLNCWGEYSKTDKLIDLIYFLQSLGQKTAKLLKNIFQIIVIVLSMQEQLQSSGVVVHFKDHEISILSQFQQFNEALNTYGIEVKIQ